MINEKHIKQEKEVVVVDADVVEDNIKPKPAVQRNKLINFKLNRFLVFSFIIFSFLAMVLMCSSQLSHQEMPDFHFEYDYPLLMGGVLRDLTISMLVLVIISLLINIFYFMYYKKSKSLLRILSYVSSFIAASIMMVCSIFFLTYGGNRSGNETVVASLVFSCLSTAIILFPFIRSVIRLINYLFKKYIKKYLVND